MGHESSGIEDNGNGVIAASRRIEASASTIFEILADPAQHPGLDGTGMLRAGAPSAVIAGAGDVFVMKMYFAPIGDYEMNNHVVEFEKNRRIGWEPAPGRGHPSAEEVFTGARPGHRWSFELIPIGADATIVREVFDCADAPQELWKAVDGGRQWIEGMTETLARLDELATKTGLGGGSAG